MIGIAAKLNYVAAVWRKWWFQVLDMMGIEAKFNVAAVVFKTLQ